MMPEVTFYICDLKEVIERIFSFKKEFTQKVDKSHSSILIKLPSSFKKIIKTQKEFSLTFKKKLIHVLKKEYPSEEKLQIFKKNLEKEWFKVHDLFFKYFKKKCGFRWPYKKFEVGILFGVCGHYEENKIFVPYADFKENVFFYPSFVVGEELFHIGYWDFFERFFRIKLNDPYNFHIKDEKFSIWHISELLPEYYLKTKPFTKFGWHKFNRVSGYPWLTKIKKIADPLWKKNLSFKDFFIELHKKCGCYPK